MSDSTTPGKLGLGLYRMSVRSQTHKEALVSALEKGIALLDTSANYTDGESETLIGEVLKRESQFNPILVTKAGYVQGSNLKELENLHQEGKAKEDLVDLGRPPQALHPS